MPVYGNYNVFALRISLQCMLQCVFSISVLCNDIIVISFYRITTAVFNLKHKVHVACHSKSSQTVAATECFLKFQVICIRYK